MRGRQTQAQPAVKPERPNAADDGSPATADGDVDMSNDDTVAQDSGYASHASPASSFESVTALGSETRRLLTTVAKLEQLGIEASGMPLPKIVAIGDQSAGKSSLIEAISEIRVPRAANTCTRCPIQISIMEQPLESWKVTLHRKYMYQPDNAYATFEQTDVDYGPWRRLSKPEDGPSLTLNSSTEIEKAIIRAQTAVLHPTDDPAAIMRGERVAFRNKPQEFSPNVIRLDITGPNLPTLILYDLPGVITQARSDSGNDLAKLIRGLAAEYIRSENTIVMLASPITNDLDNSNAYELVGRLGALDKTVTVITKADKLDAADKSQWVQLLDGTCGDEYRSGLGVIVTKQPGSDETHLSHYKARQKEREFFASDPRWTKSELARFSDRFGTGKLRETLTTLLRHEMTTGLPIIKREIGQKIAKIEEQLVNYPKPAENAYPTVLGLIAKIDTTVDAMVRGDSGKKNMMQAWKGIAAKFNSTLKEMKPVVVVKTGPEPQWRTGSSADNSIALDSDDEDTSTPAPTPGSGAKRSMAPPNTPSKRQRRTPSSVARNEYARKWSLDEIRRIVKNESTSGIPRANDPYAVDHLIKQSMENWHAPLSALFDEMENCVLQHIQAAVQSCAQSWMSTEFFRMAQRAIQELVSKVCGECLRHADRIVSAKIYKPFTFSVDTLHRFTEDELDTISQSRRASRAKMFVKVNWRKKGDVDDLDARASKVKDSELGTDPYAGEIKTMSEVRGYYFLAIGTVVDTVCELIQLEVFDRCAVEVRDHITRSLKMDSKDCFTLANRLLAEDPQRLETRQALEDEKRKLESAQRVLSEID